MKVIKAQHAGACYGVQRALDKVYSTIEKDAPVCTLGPLIHNPQVVCELQHLGVQVVDQPDQISEGTLIIRSHGVSPEVRRQVRSRGLSVVDATCPHVSRAQRAAANLGYRLGAVIVVGEFGHPEVEGLVAFAQEAGARTWVVASPADLPAHIHNKVGVVVQTTQGRKTLNAVLKALDERSVLYELEDTVCFATRQRQEAAAQLACKVDAMVVIGGRNSSNTTRLADICACSCARTHHIETPDEIDPTWFEEGETVGVTAGASTPEEQIDAVVLALTSR